MTNFVMKTWILIPLLTVLAARAHAMDFIGPGGETVIESGRLEFHSEEAVARFTFDGGVTVLATNLKVTCDRMLVTSQREGDADAPIGKMGRIREILAIGNVIITQGERRASAGRAELRPIDGLIVLSEDPVLVDPQGVMAGERITLYRGENRAYVEKPRLTLNQIPDLGPGTARESATPPAEAAPAAPTSP